MADPDVRGTPADTAANAGATVKAVLSTLTAALNAHDDYTCEQSTATGAAEPPVCDVSPAKRLADELEVLEAVRSITTVSADGVAATLAALADRAARARCSPSRSCTAAAAARPARSSPSTSTY